MFRGPHRVTHVVQAIEEAHQVMVMPRVVLGTGLLEAHTPRQPRLAGTLVGGDDGRPVVVVADEGGCRERLGHDQRRSTVPTAYIRHLGARLQLGYHALQRR